MMSGDIRLKLFPDLRLCLVIMFILVTAVAIAGCTGYQQSQGSPVTEQTTGPSGDNVTVIMKNFAFNPSEATVTKGTTVTWINQDSADHQVTSDASGTNAQGEVFSSNNLPDGASYSHTFDRTGLYPYHCAIHPTMTGTITVI